MTIKTTRNSLWMNWKIPERMYKTKDETLLGTKKKQWIINLREQKDRETLTSKSLSLDSSMFYHSHPSASNTFEAMTVSLFEKLPISSVKQGFWSHIFDPPKKISGRFCYFQQRRIFQKLCILSRIYCRCFIYRGRKKKTGKLLRNPSPIGILETK